jgi:hypothetical protein
MNANLLCRSIIGPRDKTIRLDAYLCLLSTCKWLEFLLHYHEHVKKLHVFVLQISDMGCAGRRERLDLMVHVFRCRMSMRVRKFYFKLVVVRETVLHDRKLVQSLGVKMAKFEDQEVQVQQHAVEVIDAAPKRKWQSYVWDSLDKSPEERHFLFKLDSAVLTFASLG